MSARSFAGTAHSFTCSLPSRAPLLVRSLAHSFGTELRGKQIECVDFTLFEPIVRSGPFSFEPLRFASAFGGVREGGYGMSRRKTERENDKLEKTITMASLKLILVSWLSHAEFQSVPEFISLFIQFAIFFQLFLTL